jgi:hypothetical protein
MDSGSIPEVIRDNQMAAENIVEADILVITGAITDNFADIKTRKKRVVAALAEEVYGGKSGANHHASLC